MARRKKKRLSWLRWPELASELNREIAAIVLALLAILLILAAMGWGGGLVTGLFGGLRMTLGYAAYLLPLIMGMLAWMLFQPDKYDVKLHNHIGFAGFVVALAGLLHLSIERGQAYSLAQSGQGGGMVGYGVSQLMLSLFNLVATSIILVGLLAIFLVIAANARLSDIVKRLWGLRRQGPKEEIKINEPVGLEINNRLPIKGTIGGGKAAKDEDALTVSADPNWKPPSLELLEATNTKADAGNIKDNAAIIQNTLSSFGIDVAMGEVNIGPTVTQYTLKPAPGVKLNKIAALDHNLALSLSASGVRVEAPIPGKGVVGIEVPNKSASTVRMRDIMASDEFKASKSPLTIVLGRDVSGAPALADLDKMPHLMIAGSTGSGKSVMINDLLTSLLYRNSPADLKLILVDPKRVELNLYNDIPHLLTPVIVDPEKCISALKWAVAEMERRYRLLADLGKRNIQEYNQAKKEEGMPFIVVVIDELADLMAIAAHDVEGVIVRLAQMARATGIHLVLATQRPSVDVITGLIKANIPARVAFTVASQVDSRTILDQAGAEKLLGRGDMLFASPEHIKPRRIQGAFMSEKETRAITDYLREARQPQYNEEVLTQPVRTGGRSGGGADFETVDDDLFQEAAETVIRSGKASASLLQRRLRVGYARAARLLDLLEERGVVGPADGARPRDVLVTSLSDTLDSDYAGEE